MSKQSRPLFTLSFTAQAAVIPYRGVDFTGAQIAAQGAAPAAIARRPAAAGEPFEGTVIGTEICEAGAAVAAGQLVQMDALGRVIPADPATIAAGATAVTSTGANGGILSGAYLPEAIVGRALQAAAAAGDFIEVLLKL